MYCCKVIACIVSLRRVSFAGTVLHLARRLVGVLSGSGPAITHLSDSPQPLCRQRRIRWIFRVCDIEAENNAPFHEKLDSYWTTATD